MCGIFCDIVDDDEDGEKGVCRDIDDPFLALRESMHRRGPDCMSSSCLERRTVVQDDSKEERTRTVRFASSVLWLRGLEMTRQPLEFNDGDVLLWNGDVLGGDLDVPRHLSDTRVLANELEKLEDDSSVPALFSRLLGPFAFVYYRARTKTLFFGRDFFGRHCLLLVPRNNNGRINNVLITSVANADLNPCSEVPAYGVFKMSLDEKGDCLDGLTLFPWENVGEEMLKAMEIKARKAGNLSRKAKLGAPIKSPVTLPPAPCVDSAPEIDFYEASLRENWTREEVLEKFIEFDVKSNVRKMLEVLRTSVRRRCENQTDFCKDCMLKKLQDKCQVSSDVDLECRHAKVGILFSGGLDSAVLAAVADQVLDPAEPICLVNVAFHDDSSSSPISLKQIPDRMTSLQALEELRQISPGRNYQLIEINVGKEELQKARDSTIRHLLHPSSTVLDDSIGCALWFAARGCGVVNNKDKDDKDDDDGLVGSTSLVASCPARVLLLGMGADEQLGGYSRHRSKYQSGGLDGLSEEIAMEVARISHRNLGRDNRIVADHGVAPRYPYLDEDFVNLLSSLHILEKMDLRFPRGLGEKLILRSLAFSLGLRKTATEPKRAIQFGSRIAKLENRKEKGNDVAMRE